MQDLNDLWFFAQVVEHRGFAAASRALGIPKSKLSRRIAQLEDRLGVRLLQRSTRHFAVTEIGQAYYRRCLAMVAEAEGAQETIDRTRAEPQGLVHMSCSLPLLQDRVGRIVAGFLAENPRVQVHVHATNRRVDVIEEGYDIALRVRPPPLQDTDLIIRILAQHGQALVASPELIERLGPPSDLHALGRFDSLDMERAEHLWTLEDGQGGRKTLAHQPRLRSDDLMTLRDAARAGIGLVQLPLFLVGDDLASGRLVHALPGWSPPTWIVHAVFPSRRGLIPAVRKLIDALAEDFAEGAPTSFSPAERGRGPG